MSAISPKQIAYGQNTGGNSPQGILIPKINRDKLKQKVTIKINSQLNKISQKNKDLSVFIKSSPLSDSQKVVIFFESSISLFKKLTQSLYGMCYWALKEFMCLSIKMYTWVTQFFSWIILWPLFRIFFKIKVNGRENLRGLRAPHIIISNHSYFFDSFLFRIAMGSKINMLPMRFMAVNKFNSKRLNFLQKIGILPIIYSLFGVFVVEHGLGLNKNLKRAREIIKNGGNVAMFPEGHMNKQPEVALFRRGVSALALSTGAPVLPLAIRVSKSNSADISSGIDGDADSKGVASVWSRISLWHKKTITINIGKSRYLETNHTYEELAEVLRKEVSELRDLRV